MTRARYRQTLPFLIFIYLFQSVSAATMTSELPDIGDSAGAFLSPQEEQKLGREFMRSVRQQARLVEDLDVNAYIRNLGQRLAANSGEPSRKFTFFVVDDASINAFAGPGGYIGIHTGLLLAALNESEVAGVLAHEIAHVTQRHLIRAFEASNRLGLPTLAAMLAAVLLGVATNSDAGIAAATAIQAGSLQYQINFTRANEKEADRIGIQTLSRAKMDPYGMPDFFERLQQSSRLYGERPPEFLSTHPVTSNRIAESLSRAEQVGHKGSRDSLAFHLVQARLLVLGSHNPQQTRKQFQDMLGKDKNSAAARYGLALALEKTNRPQQARRLLQSLYKQDPDRILYRTTLAQLDIDNQRSREGLALLAETLRLYPGDLTVSAHYANALLQTGQANRSRKLILDLLQNPQTQVPAVYALLARAANASGYPWQARQATAEIYYLNGQTKAAISQLEEALTDRSLDYYHRASLEARLQTMKHIAEQEE